MANDLLLLTSGGTDNLLLADGASNLLLASSGAGVVTGARACVSVTATAATQSGVRAQATLAAPGVTGFAATKKASAVGAVAAVAVSGIAPSWQQPIVARVYSRTPAGTLLATLTEPRSRGWQHRRNEPGAWSLVLDADDSQAALLARGSIVRFSLWGAERFSGPVRPPKRNTVVAAAEAGKTLEFGGPGFLALLADAPVLPERGIGAKSPEQRRFDWSSKDLDRSAYIAATEIKMQRIRLAGLPYELAPQDWPTEAADAFWIGSRGVGSPPLPVGKWYAHTEFTLAAETDAAAFVTADDWFDFRVDNEPLAVQRDGEYLWAQTYKVPMFLDAGTHYVDVQVENIDRPTAPGTNISAFICSLHKIGSGGQTIGDIVVQSDASWLALDYPAEAPTFTPGRLLRVAFTEAQAAGYIPGITWDWTDLTDSNGNAWASGVDPTVSAGTTSLLDLLRILCEQAVDVDVDHTRGMIRMFNKGTLGRDRTALVQFSAGDNQLVECVHDPVDLTMNVGLARDAMGRWTETVDAASVAAYGKVGKGVSLGTASTETGADRTMGEVLAEASTPANVARFVLDPDEGMRPYADWVVYDLIILPGDDDAPTDSRVDALTVTETDTGEPVIAGEAWQQ